jgi:acetolactate synthase-1/2/3 large subunit
MGYELPAAIGAYYSKMISDRIICIAGDGSIMMNLQELETIAGNRLNIKIFLINNFGYHSIRQTQKSFFNNNVVGCGLDSGLSFPNFEKISKAFDFEYFSINSHSNMEEIINKSLNFNGPVICEIFVDLNQQFSPKLSSRKLEDGTMVTSSLEDMAPFLSREELKSNMY